MPKQPGSRYFFRSGGRADTFWEITQTGRNLAMRTGPEGGAGRITPKKLASPEAAAAELDELVAAKLAEGYEEHTDEAVWVTGDGKKPLRVRVPLKATDARIFAYEHFQQQLDLTPLVAVKKLRELDITGHKLTSLHLEELIGCNELRELSLSSHGLRTVDLAPLAKLPKLETLFVMHLKDPPNLAPLAACKKLATLALINEGYKTLDLGPLAASKSLKKLHLQQSAKLKTIDLRPLAANKSLTLITLDESATVLGEEDVRAKITRFD
ncbi:MAG: WGR domain-containing protein [Kofleriaceae bacterium]